MDQLFCLHWNDHRSTLVSVLEKLLTNERMTDVTLSAEGQVVGAHRVILSACSEYFEQIFSICSDKHPIVFLKDVRFEDLKSLLNYMYRGEVNISQDQLPALIKTAESLKIKGLADRSDKKKRRESSGSSSSNLNKNSSINTPVINVEKRLNRSKVQTSDLDSEISNEFKPFYEENATSEPAGIKAPNSDNNFMSDNKDNYDVSTKIKEECFETDETSTDFLTSDQIDTNMDENIYAENMNDSNASGCMNWGYNQDMNNMSALGMPPNQDYISPYHPENDASCGFVCAKCGRVYKFKRNLYRHVKDECGREARHQCHLCNKKFRRKDYLRAHMTAHVAQMSENCALSSCSDVANDVLQEYAIHAAE